MKNFEKTLDRVMKEIKREILPEIKLKEPIIYYGAKECLGKFLGFNYSNNKTNKPIIRLNCAECIRCAETNNNLSLYDILLTTLLHELAHALQEIKGKSFNEREAEDFAYDYWSIGKVSKI
jgi:hypothetical protein